MRAIPAFLFAVAFSGAVEFRGAVALPGAVALVAASRQGTTTPSSSIAPPSADLASAIRCTPGP